MLDLQIILDQPQRLQKMLALRAWETVDIDKLQGLIKNNKKITQELQETQTQRNRYSKDVGAMLSKGEKAQAEKHKAQVKKITTKIARLEKEKESGEGLLDGLLSTLPNWLDPDVPGGGEDANQLVREWGQKPDFSFPPKTHYELGEQQGILNFERGVKLAGSRFYTYWGPLASLERSLLNFMLELHTREFGYTEVLVPMLVNDQAMFTTGQFPKFRGEYYRLERDDLSLIPTAEVPLVNLYQNEILSEEKLPITLCSATSCFRRESGAAGRDTRGLVRVHQFQKVELVQLAHPEGSESIHQKMVGHAEEVLRRLELPYRVVLKAAGDTGATAAKSYDLEVWMPGLQRWLEISSISNCRDYQARRGKIRFKGKQKGAQTRFVHTLNGSGVALGRCMIAIMENYQKEDLTFDIPAVLGK